MDGKNFTAIVRSALTDAQNLAVTSSHQRLTDLHLLSGLLSNDEVSLPKLLSRSGVDLVTIRQALTDELKKIPEVSSDTKEVQLQLDPALVE